MSEGKGVICSNADKRIHCNCLRSLLCTTKRYQCLRASDDRSNLVMCYIREVQFMTIRENYWWSIDRSIDSFIHWWCHWSKKRPVNFFLLSFFLSFSSSSTHWYHVDGSIRWALCSQDVTNDARRYFLSKRRCLENNNLSIRECSEEKKTMFLLFHLSLDDSLHHHFQSVLIKHRRWWSISFSVATWVVACSRQRSTHGSDFQLIEIISVYTPWMI